MTLGQQPFHQGADIVEVIPGGEAALGRSGGQAGGETIFKQRSPVQRAAGNSRLPPH
jgi:hypothetical protein